MYDRRALAASECEPPNIPMSTMRFPVAITMRRTPVANRWISERWEPLVVEVDAETVAITAIKVADDAAGTQWRFRGHWIELHRTEGEGFHLNITSPEPKVFVMWRMVEGTAAEPAACPVIVTLSYNQAARMLDGGERVDALPIPAEMLSLLQQFVAEHYKPEPRTKVRRNDPLRDERDRNGPGSRR